MSILFPKTFHLSRGRIHSSDVPCQYAHSAAAPQATREQLWPRSRAGDPAGMGKPGLLLCPTADPCLVAHGWPSAPFWRAAYLSGSPGIAANRAIVKSIWSRCENGILIMARSSSMPTWCAFGKSRWSECSSRTRGPSAKMIIALWSRKMIAWCGSTLARCASRRRSKASRSMTGMN